MQTADDYNLFQDRFFFDIATDHLIGVRTFIWSMLDILYQTLKYWFDKANKKPKLN